MELAVWISSVNLFVKIINLFRKMNYWNFQTWPARTSMIFIMVMRLKDPCFFFTKFLIEPIFAV